MAAIMAIGMNTVTVSQAKNTLLTLLRAVEERGESVQITRNGLPAGVIVPVDEWESLLETVSILSDPAAMRRAARARRELAAGRFLSHEEVWGPDDLPATLPSRRRAGSRRTPGGRRTASPKSPRKAR
jgi:prevent-host-death family protein